ncbi:hypothetical protein [Metabacillus rhizolycopersici]|uniref:Uncharacterized protein n=1 Tax=Metabacillus rhizolycopersici TaxID=2875709 RepID=A0ABS7UVW7_9BACI|nr:hypothetical protein [Metabacillus rhizolycopersici]MBZ5752452.1 hypothetical protein [Metabacillus rhizolycopersici]
MSYLKWNNLIANYFFNEAMAGREVLLFVDESLINEIGSKIGEDLNGFISSINEGPSWVNTHRNHGICRKAFQTYEDWRFRKKLRYPPYIGYLALFILAGYVEDEHYSKIAYYPKLRTLLGENEVSGQYPYFDRMISLWKDLEKWSVEDRLEELGRFKVRIRGKWRHVGLPLSQTIISSKERKDLLLIFNRAGIISSDSPDADTINRTLLEHGQDVLTKKTVRLLNGEDKNEHLQQALLELVNEELNEWDGSLPEDFVDSDSFVKSRIRICLNLNKVTRKATFSFRINSQNEIPSELLVFQRRGDLSLFNCRRSIDNWSTELKGKDGLILDSTNFNWLNGEQIEDLENRWESSLKGTPVRVFIEGQKYGLPNLVETARIEQGSRFILLCCNSYINTIIEWGQNSCETFGEINYTGVPNGWSLFHGSNPHESCIGITELTLASEIRIRLVDGLRLGKGNTFFRAAPPKILLENNKGNEVVLLNDEPLPYNKESQHWELIGNLPLDRTLTVRVLDQGNEIRRINFKITNSKISIRNKESFIETIGLHDECREPMNIGVNVYNTDIIPPDKQYPLPTYLSNEIIFIGQHPGQIYHWQGKAVAKLEWEPIWAIWKVRRRKWKVNFASTKKLTECQINKEVGNQKDLRYWKTVMCKMKKAIEKPEFPPLYELWESYLEVAKRV